MKKCDQCKKEFSPPRHFLNPKKFCSDKCRLIAWALREANKVMKKSVLVFLLLTAAGDCFAMTGTASWYSSADACGPKTNSLKGCPLANGESIYELERKNDLWIASNDLAKGTRVRVTNLDNGKSFVGTVKDRGGFKKYGRIADICKAGFQRIASTSSGTIKVKIEVLK